MSLLQPAALGFLALIPVIVLFYILRAQHRQERIPSVLFWRNISSDLEGRPSWRMPLRNLLLLLQILVVAALALGLARPSVLGGEKRNLILVLDASVSMQATDVLPSRFEAAKAKARELIDGLAAGDEVTLIRAARSPVILDSAQGNDRSPVLAALAAVAPSGGSADMVAALALASSLAGQHADARNEIVVLSDGVFPRVDVDKLGSPRANIRLETIGQSSRNVAITELSVRPMLGTIGRYVGFVRATNYGSAPVEVPLRMLADGIPIENRALQLPARGAVELTLNLPVGTKLVEAQLEGNDHLRLDDQAQAVVATERQLNVTLVSTNTLFWDRALRAIPLLKVTKVRPAAYKPAAADITIFDGYEPPPGQWPGGSVLLVNPAPPGRLDPALLPVPVLGETGPVQVARANRQSPLLEGVDLTSVSLPKSVKVKAPTWARAVAETTEGPLILDGQFEGRKVVVLAFDPIQSDLSQRLAFPILVANTVSWLTPEDLPTSVKSGSIVEIPPLPDAVEVIVRLPGGKAQAFQAKGTTIRFGQTDAIGRYVITQRSESAVLGQHVVVVNATDERASDIQPNADALGGGLVNAGSAAPGVQQETWPYLAAVALALLSGEWWYYCRRKL